MADYVSILKRTLDGLGNGATPALRERVYGRARDAVRRQLDGMVPPPAEDVKARQIEQLESAIREVEAEFGDGATPEPAAASDTAAPDTGASDTGALGAPASDAGGAEAAASGPDASEALVDASPEPRPVPEPAPTPPPAPPPVPAPEPPAPEPVANGTRPDGDTETDRSLDEATDEPAPGDDAPDDLPPVSDLPPSTDYAPPPDHASPADPVTGTPDDEARPSPNIPIDASEPGPAAPVADGQPLAPDAERRAQEPETLDADGPVGGDVPFETVPSLALIGPNGDPVLDPSMAVPLGPMPDAGPVAVAAPADAVADARSDEVANTRSDVAAPDYVPGETAGLDVAADDGARPALPDLEDDRQGPPPSTLASGAAAMPHGAELEPEPLQPMPIEPMDPAERLADPSERTADATERAADAADLGAVPASASALALASGGRFDAPPPPEADEGFETNAPTAPTAPSGLGDAAALDDVAAGGGVATEGGADGEADGPGLPRASDMPDPLAGLPPVPGTPPATSPTADSGPILADPAAAARTDDDPLAAQGSLEPPLGDPSTGLRAERDGPPDVPLAPPPREKGGRGGLIAVLVLLVALLAGGYVLRDEIADATGVEQFRTAFGLSPAIDGLLGREVAVTDGDAIDGDAIDRDMADGDTEVVAVEPATVEPATDEPAAAEDGAGDRPRVIVPDAGAPQDDAPSGDTVVADAPPKFEDRLPSDDAPIDAAPRPDDVTSTTVPIVPTDGDGTPAGTPDADGTEIAAADPVEPVAPGPDEGRVFLIGEPIAGVSARNEGGVAWSVVRESPGSGLPPEPAIRGDVRLDDGSAVEVTVRRNADDSLPASHLIEIVFALPDGGRTVSRLPLVGFKDALNVPARPLVAVPAKITDEFFVVGLNSLQSAVESNLALMRDEEFMDVQLIDGNDRRATLTLEKGDRGSEVFAEVLEAWAGSPLPG